MTSEQYALTLIEFSDFEGHLEKILTQLGKQMKLHTNDYEVLSVAI